MSGHIEVIRAIISHKTSAARASGHSTCFLFRPISFGESNPPRFRRMGKKSKSDYIVLFLYMQKKWGLLILLRSIGDRDFLPCRTRRRIEPVPADTHFLFD